MCKPSSEFTWTHSELQSALEHHTDGRLNLGPKRYELVSKKIFGTNKHSVKFVEVT